MLFLKQCLCTVIIFSIPFVCANLFGLSSTVTITLYTVQVFTLIGLPIIYYYSVGLQRLLLYPFFWGQGHIADLRKPEKFGLKRTRNFYVSNDNVSLGVWHTLPESYAEGYRGNEDFTRTLRDGSPVILYIHGNVGNRKSPYRIELYRVLSSLNCHVVALDYRCFGDSKWPTLPNGELLVSDCYAVAKWIYKHSGKSPVFLMGHSIGSAMAAKVATLISQNGFRLNGVILEAPFPQLADEIHFHPLGLFFRNLPWFEPLIVNRFYSNGEEYPTAKYVCEIPSPILILHGKNDKVIPYFLGERVYEIAKKERPANWGPTIKVIFDESKKCGHQYMYRIPEYPDILRDFINTNKVKHYSK